MNSAIILAAGSGTRFESEIPKQFTYLGNDKKMIVEYSILQFCNHDKIDEVILVVPHLNWSNKIQKEYEKINYSNALKKLKYIEGGNSRSESSKIGLYQCSKNCTNVLIHDAARPFVSKSIIDDALLYLDAYEFDAAIPTIDCDDSLINGEKLRYLQREKIKFIQTPQAFKYKKIFKAYNEISLKYKFSDDLSLLLKSDLDIKTRLFNGEKSNFKITHQNDLKRKLK
jgi:2-C-methyl-D-erythritol 4-phosphate cytidylyltransferase